MNNKYGPAPKSMDFGEAIGTCLKKYFVFEGRASKSEFTTATYISFTFSY